MRKRVLVAVAILLGVPIFAVETTVAQVLALRVVNPRVTPTMVEESWQGGQWRDLTWTRLDDLGDRVPLAVVSAEDQRFFAHHGFDLEAIQKAMEHNEKHPGRRRGASTLSQQTVKNALLWQHGGWFRKGLEAWYTVWLELLVPKERILELYLNIAQTGPTTFGFEAGARRVYGKPARALSSWEAATLAATLPYPEGWEVTDAHVIKRARWIVANPAPMDRASARRLLDK